MIIDTRKPLSPRQLEMFWHEIASIQRRWQPFFTEEQKKAISIKVSAEESVLHFSDVYNLLEEVSGEIRFIFKLVAVDDDVFDEHQLLRGRGAARKLPGQIIPKAYLKHT
jgi:hypothetical protein